MVKSQLIEQLAKKQHHLMADDISSAVNIILASVVNTLVNDGRVEIRGFGSFALRYRPPRRAHNPKTGEKLVTAPKYAIRFKPGKEVRERINQSRDRVAIQARDPDEMIEED
ncbi:MAG: integration host factor subunit beta [Gammaproteobacteria bacterium]|nr:integration host factor subunit beta [Gammaproteobacteria bacterium]